MSGTIFFCFCRQCQKSERENSRTKKTINLPSPALTIKKLRHKAFLTSNVVYICYGMILDLRFRCRPILAVDYLLINTSSGLLRVAITRHLDIRREHSNDYSWFVVYIDYAIYSSSPEQTHNPRPPVLIVMRNS